MNATVTLPIGDLDKLRDDLKVANDTVKFLESKQKQVKLVVREHVASYEINKAYRPGYSDPVSYYKNTDKLVEGDPEYINFEDVISELKKDAETAVIGKIGVLEREVLQYKKRYEDTKTNCKEDIDKASKAAEARLAQAMVERDAKEELLTKEIAQLKGEILELGKDDQIKQLTDKISELRTRTLLQRIFNLQNMNVEDIAKGNELIAKYLTRERAFQEKKTKERRCCEVGSGY